MSPTLLSNSNGSSDVPLNGHVIGPLSKNPQRTQTVSLNIGDRQERQELCIQIYYRTRAKYSTNGIIFRCVIVDRISHWALRKELFSTIFSTPQSDLLMISIESSFTQPAHTVGPYAVHIHNVYCTQSYPASKHMVHHHICSTKQTVRLLLSSFRHKIISVISLGS